MKNNHRHVRRTLALALSGGSRYPEALVDSGIDEHPVDTAVEKVPAVVRLRRRLLKARALVERQISERELWIAHQDLETTYRSVREDLYFDVGYTFGVVAGRSESRLSQPARRLAKEIRIATLMARIPAKEALAALLETTRAIVRSGEGRGRE
jgi:hypothetical protein